MSVNEGWTFATSSRSIALDRYAGANANFVRV
jgi:hypothetical protein